MSRTVKWVAVVIACVMLSACSSRVFIPREAPPKPPAGQTAGQAKASSAHFENGLRMYEKGKYRQAAKMFEQALKHDPGNYYAAYYLGMCDLQRERYEPSRSYFRLALELAPDKYTSARIHAGLGYSYEAERQMKLADEHYRMAASLDPEFRYADTARGRTERGDKQKGKEEKEKQEKKEQKAKGDD